DTRKSGDGVAGGFRCDAAGCTARLTDGTMIAVARRPEAFADDCERAALVVSQFDVPRACVAAAADRRMLASTGALALRRVDGEWQVSPVRSPIADRPWYGRAAPPDPAALDRLRRPDRALVQTNAPAAPGTAPEPESMEEGGEEE